MPTIRGVSALAAMLVVGAVTPAAMAEHAVGAHIGKHVDPGDETCFRESWGAMVNHCTRPSRFAIPVHTYWDDLQEVDVSVTAPDATHPVLCQLVTAYEGAHYSSSVEVSTSVYRRADHLLLSARFAPENPGWVLCTVYPGARINHVWFSGS